MTGTIVNTLSEAEIEKLLMLAKVTAPEIMQYADGVLPQPRRLEVRLALIENPGLMQLLESYLCTRTRVAEAFDEVCLETDPARYFNAPQEPSPRTPPTRPRRRLFGLVRPEVPSFKLRGSIVAACAALLLAALVAWFMRDFIAPDKQGLAAFPLLQKALEITASRQSARLAAHLSIEPRLTFYSQRIGRWCREYVLTYGDNALSQGQLACRGSDGVWRVRDATETVVVKDSVAPKDRTDPAGEAALNVLPRTRDYLEIKDPLDPEEERRLIANGWQGGP